jgi:hypothetical protein
MSQREDQQRAGVRLPGLLAVGLEAQAAVHEAFDQAEHRVQEGPFAAHDPDDEGPQWLGQDGHGTEQDEQLDEVRHEHQKRSGRTRA